jgi:hypothetical protein
VGVTVAGVELNNNTALTTQSERRVLNTKVTVAGVELNNNTAPNTKRTKILDVKTCRIFAINIRKRGMIHSKNGETVAGVRLDNNTASTKQSER